MTVHNFAQSRASTTTPEVEQFLHEHYTRLFPHLVNSVRNRNDNLSQLCGIDRILFLDSGAVIRCEEKIRAKDYGDFIFEYEHLSVSKGTKAGWAEQTLVCDYFTYAVPAANVFHCFPWPLLQNAWRANAERWKKAKPVIAKNPKFETYSCAVPLGELQRAIIEQMCFRGSV